MAARAASAAKTRERIVRAACVVYERVGYRAATMQAVAREADVSPATVLNHFSTPDELLATTLAALTAELGLPEPFEVTASKVLAKRVAIVTRALATCFERGEKRWQAFARDRDHPVAKAAHDAFYRKVDALVRAALGSAANDKRTLSVVSALVGWQNFQALRMTGMSADAASEAIAELVLGWLRRPKRRPR
jgi:AcrR family transcriptional regulator